MAMPQQEMLLNPAQFDTLCAKFDALVTVLTALKQAVIDLNYTGLTIEIGDLRIDRAGKVMGG